MRTIFALSITMFLISCGNEISKAVASNTVGKTAPWRLTRQNVSLMDSVANKDAACRSEFGDEYSMGRKEEALGLNVPINSYVNETDNGTESATIPNVFGANYANAAGQAPVFCIRE